ncbi:phage major tail tube protein [Shinella sp.]|jgi:P2 family phage contractile tail tube protein|uniref:phage major tail tube protein n=1 Tax=Shinella sp. TaxID=1870904 RepID=UPI003F72B4EA
MNLGQITAGDVYLNETNLVGQISEIDLGELEHQEVEHSALGMISIMKLPGRPLQAVAGKFTFSYLAASVSRKILNPTVANRFQLHSYVDMMGPDGLDREASHTVITHIRFQTMKSGGRTAKLGEPFAGELDVSITYWMQKVYGDQTPIVEYDGFNNIYNIDGEPVWPR